MDPLRFSVVSRWRNARASVLVLPHGEVLPPVFMPVGTQATLKGLTSQQIADIGYRLILANTYHLALRPGPDTLQNIGGVHKL